MRHLSAVFFYSIIIVFTFGPALFPSPGQLIFGDDIHRQYYFYRQFFNNFFKEGVFPWWNPYLFGGVPFIANPMVNIWYPPTWLFMLLPLNIAYSWHLALHVLWAMIGMRLLITIVIGNFQHEKTQTSGTNGELAAWVGGVVFGLSGFFMARTWAGHVDVIAAASWAPWVIGAMYQLQTANDMWRKYLIFSAGAFAMQLYAGYQTMAFFTLEAVGIIAVFHCFIAKKITAIVRVGVAVLTGLGLAGLQLIPEQEFFRRSIRTFAVPYEWNAYGSLTWESLKQLFYPFPFGDQVTYHGPPPNYTEHAFYFGIPALVLLSIVLFATVIHIGFYRCRKHRVLQIMPWIVIALFSVWVSMGPHAPIDLQHILRNAFPVYRYLRIPPRHLLLFVLSSGVLVGYGFYLIMTLIARRCSRGVLQMSWVIIVGVILVELASFSQGFIALKDIPEKRHDPALLAILTQDAVPYRVLPNFGVWVEPNDSLDFDSAMAYRIFSATGYDPSILKNYYEFVDAISGNRTPSILAQDVQVPYMNVSSSYVNFLNIRYVLTPPKYDSLAGQASQRYRLVQENIGRDYRLYENREALPRFYFVSTITRVGSRATAMEKFLNGEVDLRKTVVIDTSHAQSLPVLNEECDMAHASVTVRSYEPNTVRLGVDTPCASTLVSSEVMYPGWTATIDGTKSEVFEGNLAFRTVIIPAGSHELVYRYKPSIFLVGGIVSAGTLLLVVSWMKRKEKRRV